MRKILVLLSLFSFSLNANDFLYPDYSKTIGKDIFTLHIRYNFFSTEGNFDGDGDITPFPENDSFHKSDLHLLLNYGLLKNLDLGFGFRFRSNSSVQSGVEKSVYGEESFIISTRYNFLRKRRFNLALEGYIASKFYKHTDYHKINQLLILGDPGTSLGLNLMAGYGFYRILGLNALLGWHLPPNNLSQEMLYDLRLAIRLSPILIEVGFNGIFTLDTDIFDSYKEKAISHGFYRGGSNLFYSFNRTLFRPYITLAALFWNRLRLQVQVSRNVSGSSTDQGNAYGVNLLYIFGTGAKDIVKKERPPTGKMINGKIIKLTSQNKFVKLNLGTSRGVKKGRKVFFYRKTRVEDLLLARGVIYEVGVNWSIAKVGKYLKKETLKVGQIAKVLVEQ